MKPPKLDCSIIVTCYQKEEYLNDCLDSIKRQTRQPRETILVHDGCEKPLAHNIATTIILPENTGVANARDVGFKYSVGTLILFVDADDVLSPDYLQKMAEVIFKGADITYPDLFIWQGENSYLSIPPMVIDSKYIQKKSKVPIPVTSMMSRKIYEELGGFKVMPVLEDLEFFIRAMNKGYKFKKTHTLLWYRRYPETRNSIPIDKREEILKQIIAEINVK